MQPAQLQDYLHAQIPLSRAMGVRVAAADLEEVVLQAPLAPNVNHRETAFGGSVASLALLAGWSLLTLRLAAAKRSARLVIQRNDLEYLKPIPADFCARARLAHPERWGAFLGLLARRGRARIAVAATLECAGESCARFAGDFVALAAAAPAAL